MTKLEYGMVTDDLALRALRMLNWITFGTPFPGVYDIPSPETVQRERIEHLSNAALDYQLTADGITAPPTARAPDWTCGCGATLHGNETSCWRCGGKKKP